MRAVLVANRGEIVLRVFRTARRMGLRCIAVYSDADADGAWVREADEAVRIGAAAAADSYLRVDRIVDAALRTGATFVHPGYGFLAEDPRLAAACDEAGLTFVGPPAGVLEALGDKAAALRLARDAGVPVLPGGGVADAPRLGVPLVVKPAAGGGGKGMAVVRSMDALGAALASARRIALASFGDDSLIVERYVEDARHVEVQVLADRHGTAIHVLDRDCSMQRRHQKVIEEAPAPDVDAGPIRDAAVAVARAAAYLGAGTCEFLVAPDGTFGFIEMNARLQVEHPVTELVTGLDLVELQLRIAMGERIDPGVTCTGHAIEARVYAEDPSSGFLPQAGDVLHVAWPSGVRVDTAVGEGTTVPPHYDPMLAKIAVHGADRQDALGRLRAAVAAAQVLGVRTNLPLLRAVLSDDAFARGPVTTQWLERMAPPTAPAADRAVVAAAAAAHARLVLGGGKGDPWDALRGFRVSRPVTSTIVLRNEDSEHAVEVSGRGPFVVQASASVARGDGCHEWLVDGAELPVVSVGDGWLVWDGAQIELETGPRERRAEAGGAARLEAPMPGVVLAVRTTAGAAVRRGDELVVVEAMKMEHPVRAPADGVVRAVLCREGERVERGRPLVDFDAS